MKEKKRQLADKIISHIEGDTTIPYEMVLLQWCSTTSTDAFPRRITAF